MADQEAATQTEQKGSGKLVSAGKPIPFQVNIPLAEQLTQNANAGTQQSAEANTAQPAANAAAAEPPQKTEAEIAAELKLAEDAKNAAAQATNEPPKPLTDEEIKAEYEKRFPTQAALTDEQKQKQAEEFEKRMLALYLDGGGKIDQFALLKQVASADLTELSKNELNKELKAAGFNETEIAAVQKERYFQLEQAEIDAIEDPEEKALAQKKLDYGKKKLESKAAYLKENAVDFFDNLKEAVNQKDFFTKRESEFASNVEEHFSKLERKMTLELGKVDDTVLAPVEYEVSEDIIADAKETLKDPAKRKQLLFNNDGGLNYKNIAELVLKGKMFDSAAKTSYLTGATREVEKFEKIFPKNANAVGVGGSSQANNGKPGKLVSAGQPTRFRPAVAQ